MAVGASQGAVMQIGIRGVFVPAGAEEVIAADREAAAAFCRSLGGNGLEGLETGSPEKPYIVQIQLFVSAEAQLGIGKQQCAAGEDVPDVGTVAVALGRLYVVRTGSHLHVAVHGMKGLPDGSLISGV